MVLLIIAATIVGLLLLGGLFAIIALMPPSKERPRTGPDHDGWYNSYDGTDNQSGGGIGH